MSDINAAVQFALDKCWDETVGYSQTTRYLNPNVDCSSLVYYALQAGGFSVPSNVWYTGNMMGYLRNMGFTEYRYTSGFQLQHGDICVHREGTPDQGHGHAAIFASSVRCYRDNPSNYSYSTMEDYPNIIVYEDALLEAVSQRGHPEDGDQANNMGAHTEVFSHKFYSLSSSYQWYIYRWGGTPQPGKPLPIWQMFQMRKMQDENNNIKRRFYS